MTDNVEINGLLKEIKAKLEEIDRKVVRIEERVRRNEKLIYAILGFLFSLIITLLQVIH